MALANHIVDHLIETAKHLLQQPGSAGLRKVMRRRAISSAYYAVFQAVCFVFTDSVARWSSPNDIVEPVFRSLDHKLVKNRLSSSTDPQLRAIGLIFARLQEKRHDADYAPPAHNPTNAETTEAIQDALGILALIEALDPGQRRRLTASLIAKPR